MKRVKIISWTVCIKTWTLMPSFRSNLVTISRALIWRALFSYAFQGLSLASGTKKVVLINK